MRPSSWGLSVWHLSTSTGRRVSEGSLGGKNPTGNDSEHQLLLHAGLSWEVRTAGRLPGPPHLPSMTEREVLARVVAVTVVLA